MRDSNIRCGGVVCPGSWFCELQVLRLGADVTAVGSQQRDVGGAAAEEKNAWDDLFAANLE